MPSSHPVGQALELLIEQRAALLTDLAQVEEAIAALQRLTGKARAAATVDANRPSVRTKLVRLLEEAPRDWSAGEIIEEYTGRGDPIHGRDPANALRAALADAKKRGMVIQTAVGRYMATKWDPSPSNGTVLDSVEEVAMPI
ncbi:MAG: hypothetical protein CYG61_00200 [Actinobacteria bacterium]|nr:MAG: hypothetical protein CYG61_00200 [Actinomycetota bacterium]